MKLAALLSTLILAACASNASRADDATPTTPPATAVTSAPSVSAGDTQAAARQALLRAIFAPTDSLLAARGHLEALANADPKSADAQYWLALADYRLAPRVMQDPKLGARYCKDGLEHADAAIKLAPKFADALALRAGLDGLSISIEPSRAMALSSQIAEDLGQATALAPRNPRVALFDGINTFHMPKFVGGGPDKALVKLRKSQALFAAEKPANAGAIAWGTDDAFVWAGRASVALGKYDDARAYYRKALEANPANDWVKSTLLPEVDRLARAKP